MAHGEDAVTPAALEQLKMLREIVEGGGASPKFSVATNATATMTRTTTTTTRTATTKAVDSTSSAAAAATAPALRALRTLPIVTYDPAYASACSRIIDALRGGKGEEKSEEEREALDELFAGGSAIELCGFAVSSGTSGASRKLFPQAREAMRRRKEFFFLKGLLVAPTECRLGLFVPARPEILAKSPDGRDASEDRVLGPASALIHHAWMSQLTELLEKEETDPALDFDPVHCERHSYPLAIVVAPGLSVEQRLYLIWLCTLARGGSRVSLIVDTFGGSVLNAVRVLRSHGKAIAADLRAGRLLSDFLSSVAPGLRRAVDLYVGGEGGEPRLEEAQQLEEALLEEEEEAAAAAAKGNKEAPPRRRRGLLAALLPNLRLVSAIFTGSMAKYLPPMRALVSPLSTTIITEFFGGSEGSYGINEALLLHRGCLGGSGSGFPPLPEPQRFVALTGDDVFMEFLPLDGVSNSSSSEKSRGMIDGREDEGGGASNGDGENAAAAAALSVADGPVPPGRYELVVTSFCGLARYRVGDVIRVVGSFEPPPEETSNGDGGDGENGEENKAEEAERRRRLVAAKVERLRGAPVFEFVGRAGSALNLVWEKFDEGAILAAVAEAAASFSSAHWRDFAAREGLAPAGGGAPSYVFYLESSISSRDADAAAQSWADALEASLRRHNAVYEMLATRNQISPLKVAVVSKGAFDALREAEIASGTAHAQYKTPVVVEADPRGRRTGLLEEKVVGTARAFC